MALVSSDVVDLYLAASDLVFSDPDLALGALVSDLCLVASPLEYLLALLVYVQIDAF